MIKPSPFTWEIYPQQLLPCYSLAVSQLKQGLQTPGGTSWALTTITVWIFLYLHPMPVTIICTTWREATAQKVLLLQAWMCRDLKALNLLLICFGAIEQHLFHHVCSLLTLKGFPFNALLQLTVSFQKEGSFQKWFHSHQGIHHRGVPWWYRLCLPEKQISTLFRVFYLLQTFI